MTGEHWNRQGRRSGGSRPFSIPVPPVPREDAIIIQQREKIRAEFGEEGVKRFDEELLRKATKSPKT